MLPKILRMRRCLVKRPEEVLCGMPQKKSFAEALASMPNVGQDEDFERIEEPDEDAHVFD